MSRALKKEVVYLRLIEHNITAFPCLFLVMGMNLSYRSFVAIDED